MVQGSCLGPVLYNFYAITLEVVVPNDLDLDGFSNDHNLNKGLDPNDPDEELTVKSDTEHCPDDSNCWMSNNRLEMSSSWTEFILF